MSTMPFWIKVFFVALIVLLGTIIGGVVSYHIAEKISPKKLRTQRNNQLGRIKNAANRAIRVAKRELPSFDLLVLRDIDKGIVQVWVWGDGLGALVGPVVEVKVEKDPRKTNVEALIETVERRIREELDECKKFDESMKKT